MNKLIILLIITIQICSIYAIVENRWSVFRKPVTISGCARVAGALDIDSGIKFGPDFVKNPIPTDQRYVYDSRQGELDPTIWVQVCDPEPNSTPQKYRETFRFDGANGGIQAIGYKLSTPLTSNPESYKDGCNAKWIISPWGEWGGRDTNIKGFRGLDGDKGDVGLSGIQGPQGVAGVDGTSGTPGSNGDLGDDGAVGPSGPRGYNGVQGFQGDTGPTGPQGTQGDKGGVGPTGPQGNQGFTGPKGNQGAAGVTGNQGPQGDTGPTGPKGFTGVIGVLGPVGATGPKGDVGFVGITGSTGVQGTTGFTGVQGPRGFTGVDGPVGAVGVTGVTGAGGDTGPNGETGLTGPVGNQGPVGLIGITGFQGIIGVAGDTGPIGPIGANGLNGAPGTSGDAGTAGATGTPGSNATTCTTTNNFYLFRSTRYVTNWSIGGGSTNQMLAYGRLNTTITLSDGSTLAGKIDTPYCTAYCDRVVMGGYGVWSRLQVSDATTLNARTLNIRGANDLAAVNHYYWVMPNYATIELTGPQTNVFTAFQSRVFRCHPPATVAGFVTTFIPRSSTNSANLNNRCVAFVRIDFEGRVHAYRIGTCSPTFTSGSFDYFSHLDFNGFSYVPGVDNLNGKAYPTIPLGNLNVPVYNPNFYTTGITSIDDDNTPTRQPFSTLE